MSLSPFFFGCRFWAEWKGGQHKPWQCASGPRGGISVGPKVHQHSALSGILRCVTERESGWAR